MEVIKKLLFILLLSGFTSLVLKNCKEDYCFGFETEPFLYMNSASPFKVYFQNSKMLGDTLYSEGRKNELKIPFDMLDNRMTFEFFAPDSKGLLMVNYAIETFICDVSNFKQRHYIRFRSAAIDTNSSFRNIFDEDEHNLVRIDSMADLNERLNINAVYYRPFFVKF